MANPAWSDATRDLIHKRVGLPLKLFSLHRGLAFYHHPHNGKYLVEGAGELAEADLVDWDITAGVVGTDSDANGHVWAELDDNNPGAGSALINFYNDSARSVKVATATGLNSTRLTITPEAGYSLAGFVKLLIPTTDYDFRFHLSEPSVRLVSDVFDGTQIDDAQNAQAVKNAITAARAAETGVAGAFALSAGSVVNSLVRRNLVGVSAGTALLTLILKKTNGLVTKQVTGVLEAWRDAMDDNLSGSAEIKALGPTVSGAVTYPGSWTGRINGSAIQGPRSRPGIVNLTCKTTLTEVAPTFEAVFSPTDTRLAPNDGLGSEVAKERLSIGAQWLHPPWGCDGLTLDFAPTILNSVGTSLVTTTALWSVTGLKASLSTAGKLWTYYTGSVLEFYSTEAGRNSQDAEKLVTQKTLATSAVNTAFTTEDTAGLVIGGTTGAGTGGFLVAGDKGSVDFNVPSPLNGGDQVVLTISETAKGGRWNALLNAGGVGGVAHEPNTATSAPNLAEGFVRAGVPLVNAGVQGDLF